MIIGGEILQQNEKQKKKVVVEKSEKTEKTTTEAESEVGDGDNAQWAIYLGYS